MAIDNKYVRHNDKIHDPIERCEGTTTNGQCPYNKIDETNFCAMHAAQMSKVAIYNETKRNYQFQRFQQRIDELAGNDQIKSLREEVAILRMCMEEMVNRCEDATDILMSSHRISDLAVKIEKVVMSCDKLESRMGMLLPKRSVIQLAGDFVQIINSFVVDPEIIEQISDRMMQTIRKVEYHQEDA